MAQAYTPGLKVTPHTQHRVRRILPISGTVLKSVGDRVDASDVVAETFMPGNITPTNVANMLSMPPADVPECMLLAEGDTVEDGTPLAQTKGIFGMFKSTCASRVAGTIETISNVTGQVIIRGEPLPVQVTAYVSGKVVEVFDGEGVTVESDVCFIQGIFGIGGETVGPIAIACDNPEQKLSADRINDEMAGAVIVGGGRVTGDAVKRAIQIGAVAIVSGGLDDADLRDILGFDLGVAITGSERIGLTLIVTEGFGEIAMAERTHRLLTSHSGREASVNGTTQIRAGVMRPEIVIPLAADSASPESDNRATEGLLETNTPVRVIRDPYFGLIGRVADLPSEPQILGSESRARVLTVTSADGETVVVPRANIEIISE